MYIQNSFLNQNFMKSTPKGSESEIPLGHLWNPFFFDTCEIIFFFVVKQS